LAGYITDELYAGVGAYYAARFTPDHDREIGAGPFVDTSSPFPFSKPAISRGRGLRGRANAISTRGLVEIPDFYTHYQINGWLSGTYAGVHLSFGAKFRNFRRLSFFAVGLSKIIHV